MEHKGTIRIETERLILREFQKEDAIAVYENWASDEEVTKFLRWPPHKSIALTEKIVRSWTEEYSRKDFYQWAIELKRISEPIGSISVVDISESVQSVQIGYCIGRPWWHTGITKEALTAVIAFMFDEVGVNRVEAHHDVNNPHSGDVMKKCGMIYEGTLRQADVNNQGIVDMSIYGMIKEDYIKRIYEKR